MMNVGMKIPPLDIPSVSVEKMKTMAALLNDATPIHFDVEVVRALGMGDRPVNQGPANMAYVMTMLCAWAGGYDRLRDFHVRFVGNVFAEDSLRASGEVKAVRRVNGETLVDCDVRLDRLNDGSNVLLGTAIVRVDEHAHT